MHLRFNDLPRFVVEDAGGDEAVHHDPHVQIRGDLEYPKCWKKESKLEGSCHNIQWQEY